MNKLFRYAAAAVLVASFGMLSDYTADAAKFLESPREVTIVKPELPEIPQTAMVAPDMRVRFLIDKKGNVKNVFVERSSGYAPVDEAVKKSNFAVEVYPCYWHRSKGTRIHYWDDNYSA